MPEENQQFIDGSKDREYFTITPNIIINGYSATESGVYSYIKKKTGERGAFYERVRITAKKLRLNPKTFRKIRDKLVKDGRLKYLGEKKEIVDQQGGKQTVKVFRVTNIWEENIKTYKGRENSSTLKSKGVQNSSTKGVQNSATKKNLYIKKNQTVRLAKPTVRKQVKYPQADYDQVLKAYQELRDITLKGKEFDPVTQDVKTMFMSERSAGDIVGCMKWLKRGSEEWMTNWTIRTVRLKLPFYISKIKDKPIHKKY